MEAGESQLSGRKLPPQLQVAFYILQPKYVVCPAVGSSLLVLENNQEEWQDRTYITWGWGSCEASLTNNPQGVSHTWHWVVY